MIIATTRTMYTGTKTEARNSMAAQRAILLLLLFAIWGYAEGGSDQQVAETPVECPACKALGQELDFRRNEERIAADQWARAKTKVFELQQYRQEEGDLWSDDDRTLHDMEMRYWEGQRDRAVNALASIKRRIVVLSYQLAQCEADRCSAADAGGAIGLDSEAGAGDGSDPDYCTEVDWNTYLDPYYESREARLKEWQAAHEAAEKVRGYISGISDIFLERGREQLPDTASEEEVQELQRGNAQLLQILKSNQDQLQDLEAKEEEAREALDKANQELLDAERRVDERCREEQPEPQSRATIRGSVGFANVSIGTTGASGQSTPLDAASQQRGSRSAQAISGGFLEESVVESDGSLTGMRLGIEFDQPFNPGRGRPALLSGAVSGLVDLLPLERTEDDESLRLRASVLVADGSASAVRSPGELSAFILIDQSPMFGPLLGLGVDGQRASIDTELRQLELEAGLAVPAGGAGASIGLGVLLQQVELEHDMFQQDITFPEATVSTDLDVRDIFLGPKLALNTTSRVGNWAMLGQFHVAPGLLFGDGDATQRIDIFGTRDRLRISDDQTKLALQAGARGAIFKMVGDQVALGFTAGIQYQSANSAWRNPLLVSDQPAHLGMASTTMFDAGVFLYIPLGPQRGP